LIRIAEAQLDESGGEGDGEPEPAVRKRRVISARELWPGGMLETEADVEAFLGKLRSELETALAADERIQLK
jgi:hypothetical protein